MVTKVTRIVVVCIYFCLISGGLCLNSPFPFSMCFHRHEKYCCDYCTNLLVVILLQYYTPDIVILLQLAIYSTQVWLPRGLDKVSMLTHTYPHEPLNKNKVTIHNHQADSPLYVWPYLVICKFIKSMMTPNGLTETRCH